MKTLQASVKVAGTLTVPNPFSMEGDFSVSGNLADYEVNTPEKLQELAARHDWVERNPKKTYDPMGEENGEKFDRVRGSDYSLKMAQNDFRKFAA